MSEDRKKKILKKPSKKTVMMVAAAAVVVAVICLTFGPGISGGKNIEFKQLSKDKIPQSIEAEVVPEYRELERALGCLIDGKVYVLVTRGEKPTAGYEVSIEEICLEKTDKGTNMQVHALFKDPAEGETVSQVITYPYAVAQTELTALPDTIELIVKYE